MYNSYGYHKLLKGVGSLTENLIAPEQYNLVDEIEKYAKYERRKALIWRNESGLTEEMTYKELMRTVNKTANVFLSEGLKAGDKMLIMVPRLIEAYTVYLAALKIGLVVIPCSEMLRIKDLQYRIDHSEARAVLVHKPFVDTFKGLSSKETLHKWPRRGMDRA